MLKSLICNNSINRKSYIIKSQKRNFFKIIKTQTTGIKETFGKYSGMVDSGIVFYIPFVQKIYKVSNKVSNKKFVLKTKTLDNSFIEISISVQVHVKSEDSYKAHYILNDWEDQIDSHVQDAIRTKISKLYLDECFESRDEISKYVGEVLYEKLNKYGFTINDILINDISPDTETKEAMNKMVASKKLKEVAINEAEMEYIKIVRRAEADRDRKILQGQGISGQRIEIIKGYIESIDNNNTMDSKEMLKLILISQHLDTMENIGNSPNTKVLMMDKNIDSTIKDLESFKLD